MLLHPGPLGLHSAIAALIGKPSIATIAEIAEPFLSAIVAIMWKPGFSYTFYRGNVVGVLVHFFSLPLISPCIGAASISHFVNAAAKFSCCSSNKKMSPLFFISRPRSLSPFFSLSFAGLPPTFSFSLSFSYSIIQICRHDN